MFNLDEKILEPIYSFRKDIIGQLIYSAAESEIAENDKFYLEKYLLHATHYVCFCVHAVAIFVVGHKTLIERCNMYDDVSISNELPPQYIDDAEKLLIQILDNHSIGTEKFAADEETLQNNWIHLVRWIISECASESKDFENEKMFLCIFYDKAQAFAKFLAIYLSILSGKPVHIKDDDARSTEDLISDWLDSRN